MATPQEHLDIESADLKVLVDEYNAIAASQQEKTKVIIKKQARVELLQELISENG
tara:strand:- start:245 stop:409 length:165 start_codon:yes stop_codon:yes gene_type:complete